MTWSSPFGSCAKENTINFLDNSIYEFVTQLKKLHEQKNTSVEKRFATRRLVFGAHECLKFLKNGNIRAIIVARNYDGDSNRRLSSNFHSIQNICCSKNIPLIIGSSKRCLARCVRKFPYVAFVGIRDISGCEMMSVANGAPKVVTPRGEHKASFIFFHGLGDQGHGWAENFASDMRHDNIKFICPHSASRSVTLNAGFQMPAWYDLFGLSIDSLEDAEGIQLAADYAHQLIREEMQAGIPANRIAIGGFSMGGALALYAGLSFDEKLGGIVGLSSFFLQRNKFPAKCTHNNQTPVFFGHGDCDVLVPLPFGQRSETLIKAFNPNTSFHVYRGMGHSSTNEEMRDLKEFLISNLLK